MVSSPTPSRGSPGHLETWEIELAERVVQDFLATRRPFSALTFEDLVQECLTHWWVKRRHYSEARGASLATFMRRVLKAKLSDIERQQRAAKRGGYTEPLSLDAPLSSDKADRATLGDLIRDGSQERSPEQVAERGVLRDRIEHAYQLLTSRQRQLVQGLASDASMSDLSRQLGISRATLHDERRRIEKAFHNEGLEEFLR
jgi:RNA polymerase sigma factor (sigma-70 family)